MILCFEQYHDSIIVVSDDPKDSRPHSLFVGRIDVISQVQLEAFWPAKTVGIVLAATIGLSIRWYTSRR